MMTIKPIFLGLIAVPLVFTVPASGQAFKGHNSKAPVDFDAGRIEVQDRADRVILSGGVKVRQAGLNLNAARLTVAYDRSGGGTDIERLDASGGVTVSSASETATGEFAVYDLPRRLITLVGGVSLTQGANRVNGGRLVIDLDTGRAVIDGSSVGTPGVDGGGSGRVTGRFTVSDRNQ